MEDKEAQEKIAEARLAYILLNWRENFDNTMMTVQELARKLMDVLTEEFGYRRPRELLEEINLDDVESMSHFGVVRDWVFKLKDGRMIILGADIIKTIVEHENKELGYRKPGRLLTPEEIKPYCRKEVHSYGDVSIAEYEWDIDGLLQAQYDQREE